MSELPQGNKASMGSSEVINALETQSKRRNISKQREINMHRRRRGEKSIPIKVFSSTISKSPPFKLPGNPAVPSLSANDNGMTDTPTAAAGLGGNKKNFFFSPRTDSALWGFKQSAL